MYYFLWTCGGGGGGGKAPTEPEDNLPIAVDKSATIDEDTTTSITLEGSDPGGVTALIYSISTPPANGTASISANATLVYSPNLNFFGEDIIYYRVSNGVQLSTPAKVTVTVLPVNDAPIAVNQYVSTNETKFIQLSITLEAQDFDGDTVTFAIADNPSNGTLSGSGSTYSYTPNQDWHGADQFTFTANDGQLDSNVASVVIGVNPVNDTPTTNNFSLETLEDTELIFTFSYTDVDNDNVTFQVVQPPSYGTINLNDQYATYVPNSDYFGTDSFTYKANDGTVDSNTSTVTISIAGVNDAPTVDDRQVYINEDQSQLFSINASDVEGDQLEFHIISGPANGYVDRAGYSNQITYTPHPNFFGDDSLVFKAFDGEFFSENALANISVTNIDDPTEVYDTAISLDEDYITSINLPVINVDNDNITTTIVNNPTNGTISNNNGYTLDYTPNLNFHGVDNFTFYVNDGTENSSTQTVSITINAIEDVPYFPSYNDSIVYGDTLYSATSLAYDIPETDGDGDTISWDLYTSNEDNFSVVDDNGNLSLVYTKSSVTVANKSFNAQLIGVDSKGNQGNVSTITLNYIGGPAGLTSVMEFDHDWYNSLNDPMDMTDEAGLRDEKVSYVPTASLGSTGYIIENRAGSVNTQYPDRDFDRFDYWTQSSYYDIEINFNETSLAWDYANQQVASTVPFAAYAIDNQTSQRIRLYVSFIDSNENNTWDLGADSNSDGEADWTGPIYGADAWEPLYFYWPADVNNTYDPSNDGAYINQDDLQSSGACYYGNTLSDDGTSCIEPNGSQSIAYPFVTSILFTDYLENGVLPDQAGIDSGAYNAGNYSTPSAIIFDTTMGSSNKSIQRTFNNQGNLK